MPDFDDAAPMPPTVADSYIVYAIVNTDAPRDERVVAVERRRSVARASVDAGDFAHVRGRLRIRRARLTVLES